MHGRARRIGVVVVVAAVTACPKVPRESVLLTEELGGMIASSRAAHMRLVEEYVDERRQRVEEFMQREWIPTFMANYVPGSGILDSLGNASDAARQGQLMLQFAEAGLKQIARVRDAKMEALDELESLLKNEIGGHYEDMRVLNQALTAHLKSAADVTEIREDLLARVGIRADSLLPIGKINDELEKLIRAGGTAEQVIEAARSFPKTIAEILSN